MQIKNKMTREDREHHIASWKQSGKSRKDYCLAHHINYLTFSSWIAKGKAREKRGFMPIEVKTSLPVSGFATITFASGLSIALHERVEASWLHKLIS